MVDLISGFAYFTQKDLDEKPSGSVFIKDATLDKMTAEQVRLAESTTNMLMEANQDRSFYMERDEKRGGLLIKWKKL